MLNKRKMPSFVDGISQLSWQIRGRFVADSLLISVFVKRAKQKIRFVKRQADLVL